MIKEKLENICEIYQPKTISQEEMVINGNYFVFGANGIIGRYDKYNHEDSEVAITCRGATCGTINITLPKSWITGNAMVVKPKNDIIQKKYLYYYLKHINLNKVITGTAQPQITRTNLKNVIVPVVEKEIQNNIINVLDEINKAIDNRKAMICDCDNLIESNFNEMIESCTEYEKLEKLCVLKARIGWQGLTKKEYLTEGNYKLITGIDFKDGKIDFDNCVCVTKDRYDQDKYIQIKNNDILITKDGTIGKIAFVDKIDVPATLNSGVFVVRITSKLIKEKYLYYLLKADYFQTFVEKIKTGATIPHLNQAAFYNFSIPIIDVKKQDEFIEFAEKIEKQILLLKKDIYELELLQETKMHEYFD